ncbi:hypothetical protein CPB85DRAFT_817351 [Mucidula mucida]|nr:hypothetical protein CPB85DRAFT_817351 [Mucidula mucida]
MIIDEKHMYPPPPALPAYTSPPPPFTPSAAGTSAGKLTLSTCPPHILLQIVYRTFPQRDGKYEGEGKIERQRMTLQWLVTSLRLVSRALYTASMHILRSTYLPAYDSLVRPPYTSDPFPSAASPPLASSTESIFATHRELATLDSFIALLAHEDLMLDATTLHLPREEAYKDLFDFMQPRSRLEDLVREIGVADGVIFNGDPSECPIRVTSATNSFPNPAASSSNEPPSPLASPSRSSFNLFSKSSIKASLSRVKRSPPNSTPPSPLPPPSQISHVPVKITPVPFAYLSVSFTPRRVASLERLV